VRACVRGFTRSAFSQRSLAVLGINLTVQLALILPCLEMIRPAVCSGQIADARSPRVF
jgi:hypothetical protein